MEPIRIYYSVARVHLASHPIYLGGEPSVWIQANAGIMPSPPPIPLSKHLSPPWLYQFSLALVDDPLG
jgi:hypothetical protein